MTTRVTLEHAPAAAVAPVAAPPPSAGAPLPATDPAAFAALPLAVAVARVMLEQLERIFAHEPGVRAGDDPEDVHKMRVATRRLRAARRVFREAMAGAVDLERANGDLKILATALGRVRDLDVFGAALRKHALAAPEADWPALERLIASRERERGAAREELRALLDSGALSYLRTDFHHSLDSLARREGAGRRKSVARCAPRLIVRALRRLYGHQSALLAPSVTDLHEVRIAAKRARYTCEAFAPAFGDAVDETIARLKDIQDTLGEVHDADIAVTFLLGMIQEVAAEPGLPLDRSTDGARPPATDAAPIARLISRYQDEREACLPTFRDQWAACPEPKTLRRSLTVPA